MQALLDLMIRKRKNVTLSIDTLVWEAIDKAAKNQGISASRWIENFTFDSLKAMGLISANEERLGETRGGDRKSKDYQKDIE
jgi:hypothetical protein